MSKPPVTSLTSTTTQQSISWRFLEASHGFLPSFQQLNPISSQLTNWPSNCLTHSVLEFNRAATSAPQSNPQARWTSSPVHSSGQSSSQPSFAALLESFASGALAEQSTNLASDSMIQPLSNQNTSDAIQANPFGSTGTESFNWNDPTTLQQPGVSFQASTETTPTTQSTAMNNSFRSSGPGRISKAHNASVDSGGEGNSDASEASATTSRSSEKPKAHKETDAGETKGDTQTSVAGTNGGTTDLLKPVAADSNSNSATGTKEDGLTAPETRSTAGKTSSSADLAFAVKIQSPNAATGNESGQINPQNPASSDTTNPDGAATTAFASQLSAMTAVIMPRSMSMPTGSSNDAAAALSASAASVSSAAGSYQSNAESPDDVPEADQPAATEIVTHEPVATNPEIKTVQVQIAGAGDQRVDLKLMEKSGSLTMSVRSADGNLTRALQQNLPELSSNLSKQQVNAEWWQPTVQTSMATPKHSSSSDSGQDPANQNAGGQNPGKQSNGNSGQQGGRDARQPDWLQELSSSSKSNQIGTQFSWQL